MHSLRVDGTWELAQGWTVQVTLCPPWKWVSSKSGSLVGLNGDLVKLQTTPYMGLSK